MTVRIPRDPATTTLARLLPPDTVGPLPPNPAPYGLEGQTDHDRVAALADQIVRVYLNSLPSNYVSAVGGPHYVQQFRAIAQELARIQITAHDAYEDADFDFTRTEVLYQFLASLVFPDGPTVELNGDLTYREFLQRMVGFLLAGSRYTTLASGLEALEGGEVALRSVEGDSFLFEVDVSHTPSTTSREALGVDSHYHSLTLSSAGTGVASAPHYATGAGPDHTHLVTSWRVEEGAGTGQARHTHDLRSQFPALPFLLERNVRLVLGALDPAQNLYRYRHLFREILLQWADAVVGWSLAAHHYEDLRWDWGGAAPLEQSSGVFFSDRTLFHDSGRDFRAVRVGAELSVAVASPAVGTPREQRYRVREVRIYPYGDDPIARAYTSSPTGLTGSLRVQGGALVDGAQNWALAVPGELVTVLAGPNAGTYRLELLQGPGGGLLGRAPGPATAAIPVPSYLRVTPPAPQAATGLTYRVERDPRGTRRVRTVTEDLSNQAWGTAGSVTELRVARGPLVGTAGAVVPATVRDVTVVYDTTPLALASLNPYTGTLTLAAPLTCYAPGAHTLTVSYSWYPAPVFPLSGLNQPGLNLNRGAGQRGRLSTTPGVAVGVGGVGVPSRFNLGVVLGHGLSRRPAPRLVAHRFVAYDRLYTATLNSPLSLVLNAAPGRTAVPYAWAGLEAGTAHYDASLGEIPSAPWERAGTVESTFSGSRYRLTPTGELEPGYWRAELSTVGAVNVNLAVRVQVTPRTLEGVWTGVGVGFIDSQRIYLVGALVVANPAAPSAAPLQHLGVLLRARDPAALSSWYVGPQALGRVELRTGTPPRAAVVTFATSTLPTLLARGDRFQVLGGSQAGVYTVEDLYQGEDGRTAVVVDPAFPANPDLAGNAEITVYFETRWEAAPATWRLYVQPRTRTVSVYYGGASGAQLASLSLQVSTVDTLLPDLAPSSRGRVFWGHLSREARSESVWDLVRSESAPAPDQQSRGTVRDLTPSTDPVDSDWYPTGPWGEWKAAAPRIRLSAHATSAGLGTRYGYGYRDPYLDGRRVTALEAKVSVQRTVLGTGGAALVVRDPFREAHLSVVRCYAPSAGVRAVLSLPSVCLVGSVLPAAQGWVEDESGISPEVVTAGALVRLRGGADPWRLYTTLSVGARGSYLLLTLAVREASAGAGRLGLWVGVEFAGRRVVLEWVGTNTIALVPTPGGGAVVSVAGGWSDGAPHTYEILHTLDNQLTLKVDGVTLATSSTAAFPVSSDSVPLVSLGNAPDLTPRSYRATLTTLCKAATDEGVTGMERTWGIHLGGDYDNVNNWALARTDSSSAPNSDSAAALLVSHNWTAESWVRLFIDPNYGAVLLRPDLDPPPGYSGDWATNSLDPTAAWIRVEYNRLPRRATVGMLGEVEWGSVRAGAAAETTWQAVRHRVFTHTSTDYRAPHRMVLNKAHVVTSGDALHDVTPERVIVAAMTRHRVSLRPVHIYAARIWTVLLEGVPLPSTGWTFNADSQEIYLTQALPDDYYPVEVVFAPGRPYTTTYLASLPVEQSTTLLGEGTPPVEWSQVGTLSWATVSGDGGPTPAFPPESPSNPNYFLRDPYLVRAPVDGAHLYDRITAFARTNGGVEGQTTGWTDTADGQLGPTELGLSGTPYTETYAPDLRTYRHAGVYGGGVFVASGGGAGTGTRLGPGPMAAVLPLAGDAGQLLDIRWEIAPPRYADTFSAHTSPPGSQTYRVDSAAVYSRVGPWVGGIALTPQSLLAGSSPLQPEGFPVGGVAFTLRGGAPLPMSSLPQTGTL